MKGYALAIVNPVPEPSSCFLLAHRISLVALWARRSNAKGIGGPWPNGGNNCVSVCRKRAAEPSSGACGGDQVQRLVRRRGRDGLLVAEGFLARLSIEYSGEYSGPSSPSLLKAE